MGVLRRVAGSPAGATFSELLGELDIPKSTLHRLLHALVAERLLRFDEPERRYKLGYGMFELARHAWERTDIRGEAQQVIADLVRDTGETVHLAVLDGLEVVYIDKIEGSHTIRMASTVGARNPAYCTGVGKVLLAFVEPEELVRRFDGHAFQVFTPNTITSVQQLSEEMARIRNSHFAVDNEEHEIGIRCAAAPIFNYRGAAIASISVTVPTFRWDSQRFRSLTERVRTAAGTITANCGGVAPPLDRVVRTTPSSATARHSH